LCRCLQHSTDDGSTSKLTILFAPRLKAAKEKRPLPHPTSRNVLPCRFSRPKNSERLDLAILNLSSFRLLRNFCQFFPNEKVILSSMRLILYHLIITGN
jgi:hypothetical protein